MNKLNTQAFRLVGKSYRYQYPTNVRYFSKTSQVSKYNTVINICPQGYEMVIERLGRYLRTQEPGLFLAIPLIDRISYTFDMREKTISIDPQMAITHDNATLEMSGNLFIQCVDAKRGAYGAEDPIRSITEHAKAAMRSIIGQNTLDVLLKERESINQMIIAELEKSTDPWGMKVRRYEITQITTEKNIHDAMNTQVVAERKRREEVLQAEAVKRGLELRSEGERQKLTNESEGAKVSAINQAQGEAASIKALADARYYDALKEAEARAKTLEILGEKLCTSNGKEAANLNIALKYIEEYGKVVGKSNTLILSENMNDITSFVAKAKKIYEQI